MKEKENCIICVCKMLNVANVILIKLKNMISEFQQI